VKVTAHEMLAINELLRNEAVGVKKMQAILPMVADEDLRAEITNCIQTDTAHIKALVKFCEANQLA